MKSVLDKDEFELPETVFVRHIEDRVFQGIILHCLAKIEGISLVEGNFIDNFLSKDSVEGVRGIHAEQDTKHQSLSIRVEVNVCYGIPIPQKAEEIQSLIAEEVTKLTGLHVASIHVIFNDIAPTQPIEQLHPKEKAPSLLTDTTPSAPLYPDAP